MASVTSATEQHNISPSGVGLAPEGIVPNIDRIVATWNAGRIPILFFAPDGHESWPCELGWNGQRIHLARMTKGQVFRYANALVWICPNGVAARWLRRKIGPPRLLVLCGGGQRAYLNFDTETGFTSEQGA